MHFQQNGEMYPRLEEALHPEFHVALQSEDLHLDGVHQSMDQGTLRQHLVESDDVEEDNGVHMGDRGGFKTEFSHLREKLRYSNPGPAELNNANAIKQSCGEVGPHSSLALIR